MEMSTVKNKYSASLFLGLLNIIIFIFWIQIPYKSVALFLFGILILLIGRSFIANAYKIIKGHYEEGIARKIKNSIRIWGFTFTLLISGVAYFYDPIPTVLFGLLSSLTLITVIYQKY